MIRFCLALIATCLASCTSSRQDDTARASVAANAALSDSLVAGDSLAPTMPRTFHDVCEGEDCQTSFQAFACTPLTLHADTLDASPVVARVPAHDTVAVTHIDLHLTAPGIVVVRKSFLLNWDLDMDAARMPRRDTVRFAAGDTLFLLHYLQLGSWRWWYRGRVSSGGEFWDGKLRALNGGSEVRDSSVAEIVSRPEHDTWWRVELSPKRGGWWHAGTEHEAALTAYDMGYWGDACRAAP